MDVLRLIKGLPTPGIALGCDAGFRHHCQPAKVSALGSRAASGNAAETAPAVAAVASVKQSYLFPLQLTRLWPGGGGGGGGGGGEGDAAEKGSEEASAAALHEDGREELAVAEKENDQKPEAAEDGPRGNWVLKILRVGSAWADREGQAEAGDREVAAAAEEGDRCIGCGGDGTDEGCIVADEEERIVFDRESFSRLLQKVSLAETELYAKMSYLGNLAYMIPKIKPRNLLKHHGLIFVTSSLDQKGKCKASQEQKPTQDQDLTEDSKSNTDVPYRETWVENSDGISPPAAYEIAASAASYLQYQRKGILSGAGNGLNKDERECITSDEASFLATTNSVTSVIAGKEEMKQAVAKDLNSAKSLPCEWFICDDESSATRYFVIQGSETLASWQTNLLFEPVQFEGFDVLVHRGIYEAAKGMYQQMLPEVRTHIKAYGESASLRFTGHSLGGSLALLINLMLLIRGEVPVSSLLPVITFGAPTIMCGGDYLLHKLGLPKCHVQAITMHRDIVPRAFSCNYPDHIAHILKAINGNFRNHPCLLNQKFLYAPMGKLLILQPGEEFSPNHHLLPPGSGFYLLGNSLADSDDSTKLLQEAQSAFLNSPHPLEILSDRSAYGSEGTVYRDHDVNSYLRSVHYVIRQELKAIRKAKRKERRQEWWSLLATQSVKASVVTAQCAGSANSTQHHFSFAGVLNGGRQTLKRLGNLVASHHVHMLVLLLFPVRLVLLGTLVC